MTPVTPRNLMRGPELYPRAQGLQDHVVLEEVQARDAKAEDHGG